MLTKLRYDLKLSPDAPRPFIIRTHTSWPAHPFPRRDGVPAIFASTQFHPTLPKFKYMRRNQAPL